MLCGKKLQINLLSITFIVILVTSFSNPLELFAETARLSNNANIELNLTDSGVNGRESAGRASSRSFDLYTSDTGDGILYRIQSGRAVPYLTESGERIVEIPRGQSGNTVAGTHYGVATDEEGVYRRLMYSRDTGLEPSSGASGDHYFRVRDGIVEEDFWVDSEGNTTGTLDNTIRDIGPTTLGGVVTESISNLGSSIKERVTAFMDCGFDLGCHMTNMAYHVIMAPAAFMVRISGEFFDFMLRFSVINMKQTVFAGAGESSVDLGWKIFRDLTNIMLIFVLLYLSIKTIVSGLGNVKKQITTVIFVAIMINFSMFFTKIFIDFSNILALSFHNQIVSVVENPDGTTNFRASDLTGDDRTSIAGVFISNTRIVSIYDKESGVDSVYILQQALVGALLMFVVAIVMFIASILLLVRLIVLIFIIMMSSIAIGSLILPKLRSAIFDKWFSALIGQSMVAPILLFMFYLSLLFIIRVPASDRGLEDIMSANVLDLVPYIMTIGFLIFSLMIAKKLGDQAGSMSGKITAGIGGAALGGAAFAGRRIGGSTARFAANKIQGNNVASRALKGGLNKAAGASWDARNAKSFKKVSGISGVELGKAGGKGGYDALAKKADKKREANYKMVGEQTTKEKRTMDTYNQAIVNNSGLDQYLAIREADKKIDDVRNSDRMADLGQKEHEGTLTQEEKSELDMMKKIISEQQKIVDKSKGALKAEDLESLEKIGEAQIESFEQMRKDASAAKKAGGKRQESYINRATTGSTAKSKLGKVFKYNVPYTNSHVRFAQAQRGKNIKDKNKSDIDKIVEGVTKGTKKESGDDKKDSGSDKKES